MFTIPPPGEKHRLLGHSGAGFTIIEMLASMTVIIILATILVSSGAFGPRSGRRPVDAMQMVVQMTEIARLKARESLVPARVAVCVDSIGNEKYLRYAVNLLWIEEDEDGDGIIQDDEEGWKIFGRGRRLPDGTAFYKGFSTLADTTNSLRINLDDPTGLHDDDNTVGVNFTYIEFNEFGEPSASGTQWVFVKAVTNDAGNDPMIPDPLDRDGFIVRQTGMLAVFEYPDQIAAPSP